mgnify:CR=1 FL=1
MTKTLYNNWADVPSSAWKWPSFSPHEIACRGTGKLMVDERAMDMLQALRDEIGKPMILNSAYRSPEHNKRVGGATRSKHLEGIAFDCRMENHDPQDFMAAARKVGFKGIGEYPVLGFCHVDARSTPASWTGSRGKRFPVRAVTQRFAPETEITPKTDASKQAGGILAASVAAESVLTSLAAEAAPILPENWITYLIMATATLALVRIVWPLVFKPSEDEDVL